MSGVIQRPVSLFFSLRHVLAPSLRKDLNHDRPNHGFHLSHSDRVPILHDLKAGTFQIRRGEL